MKIFSIQIMYSTDFSGSSPHHLGTRGQQFSKMNQLAPIRREKKDSTQVASCCETEERLNGCIRRISEVH